MTHHDSDTRRPQRVADLLQHEIARILQQDVKDPRIGLATITGAEVSPDLRVARVYYTVFGGPDSRHNTQQGLDSATPFIRRQVGRLLRLKAVPDIRFLYDESIARGFRIAEILEDMEDAAEEPAD